ncbi:hypothetical protein Pfo_031653, partial [Paulownia fortunei]
RDGQVDDHRRAAGSPSTRGSCRSSRGPSPSGIRRRERGEHLADDLGMPCRPSCSETPSSTRPVEPGRPRGAGRVGRPARRAPTGRARASAAAVPPRSAAASTSGRSCRCRAPSWRCSRSSTSRRSTVRRAARRRHHRRPRPAAQAHDRGPGREERHGRRPARGPRVADPHVRHRHGRGDRHRRRREDHRPGREAPAGRSPSNLAIIGLQRGRVATPSRTGPGSAPGPFVRPPGRAPGTGGTTAMTTIPTLSHGRVTIRPLRLRDTRDLDVALATNRSWLRTWPPTLRTRLHRRPRQHPGTAGNARAGLGSAVRDGARRSLRRPAQRVRHHLRLARQCVHRLLGRRGAAGTTSRRSRSRWRSTTASGSSASTASRSASVRRTRRACGSSRSSASGSRACAAGTSTSTATGATTSASPSSRKRCARESSTAGSPQARRADARPELDAGQRAEAPVRRAPRGARAVAESSAELAARLRERVAEAKAEAEAEAAASGRGRPTRRSPVSRMR